MSRYRFLREPRWLALGFLVLLVVPAFFLLSRWQLSRLDDRRYNNDLVTTHAYETPAPLDSVMAAGAPQATVGDAQRWLPVTATGRYDATREVLVRKRPLQGRNGFWVVTPLVTPSGAVLAVNRGWVEASGSASAVQAVPAPPTGEVTVTGRVQPSESAPVQPPDLPAGQVTDLDVALVAGSAPAYPGYVQLESSEPAQADGLTPLPLPDLSDGPHLSYAIQWVFFAIVAVTGFVMLARRERDYADTTTRTDLAPPAGAPGPG